MPEKWVKDKTLKNGYTYRKVKERREVILREKKYWNMNNWIFPKKIIKEGSFNDDS